MSTLFEKFAFMLNEIIGLPGTWSEKKEAIKRHVDDKVLSEFISWFEEEADAISMSDEFNNEEEEDEEEDEDIFDEFEDEDEEEDEWEGAV